MNNYISEDDVRRMEALLARISKWGTSRVKDDNGLAGRIEDISRCRGAIEEFEERRLSIGREFTAQKKEVDEIFNHFTVTLKAREKDLNRECRRYHQETIVPEQKEDPERETPYTQTSHVTSRYNPKVTSIRELCRAIADGELSEKVVEVRLSELRKIADSQRALTNIPGVEVTRGLNLVIKKRKDWDA